MLARDVGTRVGMLLGKAKEASIKAAGTGSVQKERAMLAKASKAMVLVRKERGAAKARDGMDRMGPRASQVARRVLASNQWWRGDRAGNLRSVCVTPDYFPCDCVDV